MCRQIAVDRQSGIILFPSPHGVRLEEACTLGALVVQCLQGHQNWQAYGRSAQSRALPAVAETNITWIKVDTCTFAYPETMPLKSRSYLVLVFTLSSICRLRGEQHKQAV